MIKILTLGIPRSGSTWLFNVILAILGEENIPYCHGFAETENEYFAILDETKAFCVIKAHKLDNRLLERCWGENWLIITTTRGVGDSIVSQIDMFGVDLPSAAQETLNSLASMDELKDRVGLKLRYESNFFSNKSTLRAICNLVGLAPSEQVIGNIFRSHLSTNLKKTIAEAPVVETRENLGEVVEVATNGLRWYQGHVKDGRIGKYKERLSPVQMQYLGGLFSDLDVAPYIFPFDIVVDRAGVRNGKFRFYRLTGDDGRDRARLDIGPFVSLPAGYYDVFFFNSRFFELMPLSPIVGILAGDQIVSIRYGNLFNFTKFSLHVPFPNRLMPHSFRIEVDFQGWIPNEAMMPESILICRRG